MVALPLSEYWATIDAQPKVEAITGVEYLQADMFFRANVILFANNSIRSLLSTFLSMRVKAPSVLSLAL